VSSVPNTNIYIYDIFKQYRNVYIGGGGGRSVTRDIRSVSTLHCPRTSFRSSDRPIACIVYEETRRSFVIYYITLIIISITIYTSVCVCVCVWIPETSRARRLTISLLLLWRGWQIPADGEKRLPTRSPPPPAFDTRAFVWYITHIPTSRCIRRHYNYRLKPLQLPGSALSGRPPEHRTHRAQMTKGIIGGRRGESAAEGDAQTGRPYANKYFIVYIKYIM